MLISRLMCVFVCILIRGNVPQPLLSALDLSFFIVELKKFELGLSHGFGIRV